MRSCLLALVLVLVSLPAAAQGPSARSVDRGGPTLERVRGLLSGVDTMPSDDVWRRLGPDTLATLIALYDDPSTPYFVRLRAVSTGALYPTPAAKTFLEAVARAPGQRDLMVRRALVALGRAFGADALASVRPFLSHPETSVREGAALTIAAMATPAARAALEARASVETDPTVRDALGR